MQSRSHKAEAWVLLCTPSVASAHLQGRHHLWALTLQGQRSEGLARLQQWRRHQDLHRTYVV